MHAHTHTYMPTHIHTYIHACPHTYIHTYMMFFTSFSLLYFTISPLYGFYMAVLIACNYNMDMFVTSDRTWCCSCLPGYNHDRLNEMYITVDNRECWRWTDRREPPTQFNVTCNQTGREVKFQVNRTEYFSLCEVLIFGMLVHFSDQQILLHVYLEHVIT